MNGFEGAARAKKVLALIEAIDGLNAAPKVDPRALYGALREQDAGWWNEVARIAEVPNPSETTRAWVLQVYERRALKAEARAIAEAS